MQGVFVSSFTYTPPLILRRQLLPFSPFHGLLLEAADSPYLAGGPKSIDDAILGAWVCSHSFADGYLGTMDFPSIRAWSKKCRRLKPLVTARALDDFAEYITASLQRPERWPDGKEKPSRAPIWWLLATFAQSRLHMTEEAAWDCSVMKLLCYLVCRNEAEGDTSLMSDYESMMIANKAKEKEA